LSAREVVLEQTRYKVEQHKVTAEVIDNEVIIIHFDTGNYYTVAKVGAYVWDLLGRQVAVEDLLDVVVIAYPDAPPETVRSQVKQFIAELAAEDLITPCASHETTTGGVPSPLPDRSSYETPVLEKYTDMQALLLIDPIHEVDDRGWPHLDKPTT
jgi:coenzyme PQQ synthesis protein D (PqqD)